MKIAAPSDGITNRTQAIGELEEFLQKIQRPLTQPCPNCTNPAQAGNPDVCNWQCAAAPRALSSEPDNHPIESNAVKIVFELRQLGLFEPCWSCEGHLDPSGQIYRLPQVSFYCANPMYVVILHEHVDLLHYSKHLHAFWHIAMTSLGQKMGVTYLLEPLLKEDTPISLDELQEDLHHIGDNLAYRLKTIAEARLAKLKMNPPAPEGHQGQRR